MSQLVNSTSAFITGQDWSCCQWTVTRHQLHLGHVLLADPLICCHVDSNLDRNLPATTGSFRIDFLRLPLALGDHLAIARVDRRHQRTLFHPDNDLTS